MALLAASGAACTTVLGLVEPTLEPCPDGCPDVNVPFTDAGGSSSGGDSAPPADAPAESAPLDATPPDAPPDAIPDVVPDRGPSSGTRCGTVGSALFCALPDVCCLTLDDAGGASYACGSSASTCAGGGGYAIACATNNDCNGTDVCCFYNSAIKCEPVNTGSCANVLVCDPAGPSDQCPTGQKCTIAYVENGYTLPYYGCH